MHSEDTTRSELRQTKPCSKCGEVLPLSEFSPDKRMNLGVGSSCKSCNRKRMHSCVERYRGTTSARNSRYRELNGDELSEKNRLWRFENRERISESRRSKYPEIRERALAYLKVWQEEHREKIRVNQRAYYREHKADHIARNREWRRRNPLLFKASLKARRAAKLGAGVVTLTAAEWEQIKIDFGNRCAYCGRDEIRLTQDHVIPLSKGGPHTFDNVIPACQPCNSSKGVGDYPKTINGRSES